MERFLDYQTRQLLKKNQRFRARLRLIVGIALVVFFLASISSIWFGVKVVSATAAEPSSNNAATLANVNEFFTHKQT